jgi:RNA polymerase sigma-70 factor (ECF subfamily)
MDLLARFAAGDLDAFESLFRQYQQEVFRWIMRIVRNTATAEDLTVEAFWRAHRAHARFDAAKGNFAGWMRRIATNVAIDHLRRSRTEVALPEDLPAIAPLPLEDQMEMRSQIHSAIGKLSPNVRSAVLLALVEEEPYEEIASALGISVNAVKVRVFRGVRILRKELSRLGAHV